MYCFRDSNLSPYWLVCTRRRQDACSVGVELGVHFAAADAGFAEDPEVELEPVGHEGFGH